MSAVWSPSGLGLELCVAVEIAVFLVVQWRLYTDIHGAVLLRECLHRAGVLMKRGMN